VFDAFFQRSHHPMLVQDISWPAARLRELRRQGVADLEAHLRAHPEFVRAAWEHVTIEAINEAGQVALGLPPGPFPAALLRERAGEDYDAALVQAMVGLYEGRPHAVRETRLVDGGGASHHIQLQNVFVGEVGHERVVVVVVDVTAQRDAEREVERQRALLSHAEALDRISAANSAAARPEELPRYAVALVRELLDADRALLLHPCDPDAERFFVPYYDTAPAWAPSAELAAEVARGLPVGIHTAACARAALAGPGPIVHGPGSGPVAQLARLGVRSLITLAIRPAYSAPWLLVLHQCGRDRTWTAADRGLLRTLGERLGDSLGAAQLRRDLDATNERLSLALAAADAGLFDWSIPDDHLHADERFGALLGLPAGELPTRMADWSARRHPDDGEVADHVLAEALGDPGGRFAAELRFRHRDGAWRWLQVAGRVVSWGQDREPLRMVGIAVDVTARRAAQRDLLEQRERAMVTLRSIADAVITTDAAGRVDSLNPVAEDLTGWTITEAVGRPLAEVFQVVSQDTGEPADDLVRRCLDDAAPAVTSEDQVVLLGRRGERFAIRHTAAPIRGPAGQVLGVVLVFTDETERRAMASRIRYQATHDALTGLVNRRELERRLALALRSAAGGGRVHALCYLDLDRFKLVNDTAGHAAGDQLLEQVAEVLQGAVRSGDTLARVGGDEFCVLLLDSSVSEARAVAHRLVASVGAMRFRWGEDAFAPSVSVGVVSIDATATDISRVIGRADAACYVAKDRGGGCAEYFDSRAADGVRHEAEARLTAEVDAAVTAGRVAIYAQPIVALAAAAVPVGYELSARLIDSDGGLLEPARYLPIAERHDRLVAIEGTMLERALGGGWGPSGAPRSFLLARLSGPALADRDHGRRVATLLGASDGPRPTVWLTLAEVDLASHLDRARELMDTLRPLGCRFVLQGFGSGLSSLEYLRDLAFDLLTIDGHFIRGLADDPTSRATVVALQQLARALGVRTLAAQVESEVTLQRLRDIGVDFACGAYLGSPVPLESLRPSGAAAAASPRSEGE